jgi:hypothetical protein
MASVTPTTVIQGSLGDFRLVIATFADTTDDGDTWASGLKGYVRHWTNDTDDPTTQGSVGVAAAQSNGTFTFYPAEDNKSFDLFILLRS